MTRLLTTLALCAAFTAPTMAAELPSAFECDRGEFEVIGDKLKMTSKVSGKSVLLQISEKQTDDGLVLWAGPMESEIMIEADSDALPGQVKITGTVDTAPWMAELGKLWSTDTATGCEIVR